MNYHGFPSISVVIPTWNGRSLLETMFPSLLAALGFYEQLSGSAWEIIVVDDGSSDGTVRWVETIPEKRVKIVTRRRNGGFAAACNAGFSACHHEVVVLLNNDVLVAKEFLPPLVRHFQADKIFAVTCKALGKDRETFCTGGKIGEFRRGFWKAFQNYDVASGQQGNQQWISFAVCGGFCAFDRRKLIDLGGFEPLMSPFYWEDVELSYRAWKRGWKILYEPESVVFHDASTTIRSQFRKGRIERINQRNRLIFLWKNLHDPLMLLTHLGSTLLLLLQAILLFRPAFLLGFWDTLKLFPAIFPKRIQERRLRVVGDRQLRKMFQQFQKEASVLLK